jgi:hypothetical protein
MIKLINRLTKHLFKPMVHGNDHAEKNLLISAKIISSINAERSRINDLSDVEYQVFSQWGEDGIIDWLISRIPDIKTTFVEFGTQNYRESNTRYLLMARNWRGLVMDGSSAHIRDIQAQDIYWRHGLTAKCAFIDKDNINDLLAEEGFGGQIGLLSVDIDGNDYWVWQALTVADPAIVVCEYNAVFGDRYALTVPYQADFQRTRAHHSNLYFGASLLALKSLASSKGYTFVGTTSPGCNAFFVRNDMATAITSALGAAWAFPSMVREARDAEGRLIFLSGEDRIRQIADLPLVDLDRNQLTTLGQLGELYSPEWKASLKVSA